MNEAFEQQLAEPEEPNLVVDVDGYEGPIDLLLDLARRQKVDLARISILALAEQYLAFVEEAHRLRLELAADYLVMAAWLAYLKSRLLLPEAPKGEDPPASDLAAALAFRLRRLDAMRAAGERLMGRPRLGIEVFGRGMPEGVRLAETGPFTASLHDLLSAYARQRQQRALARVELPRRAVWTLAEARELLETLVGPAAGWLALDTYLEPYLADRAIRATVRASSFSASLELAREGRVQLRQDTAFGPLYLRASPPPAGTRP